jgi:hypothetical protein
LASLVRISPRSDAIDYSPFAIPSGLQRPSRVARNSSAETRTGLAGSARCNKGLLGIIAGVTPTTVCGELPGSTSSRTIGTASHLVAGPAAVRLRTTLDLAARGLRLGQSTSRCPELQSQSPAQRYQQTTKSQAATPPDHLAEGMPVASSTSDCMSLTRACGSSAVLKK